MHLSMLAPAKVNLCLLVGPSRPDGYHELFTVFAPVDLGDRLSFDLSLGAAAQRPGTLSLACPDLDGEGDPDPERNLAVRALRALEAAADRAIVGGVEIEKGIPVGAGLGGGSADAAAALLAGARLLAEEGDMEVGPEILHALATSLGADVPFFLGEGAALGRGIGDRLEPIALPSVPVVVVMPREPLSTPTVYAAFDRLAAPEDLGQFAARAGSAEKAWRELAADWRRGNMAKTEAVEAIASLLENDLETASFALLPDLPETKRALLDAGAAGALMSGSGPTMFGVCRSADEAEAVCLRLEARGYAARPVIAGSPA